MDEWKAFLPESLKRLPRNTLARKAFAFVLEHFPEIVAVVGSVVIGWGMADLMPF